MSSNANRPIDINDNTDEELMTFLDKQADTNIVKRKKSTRSMKELPTSRGRRSRQWGVYTRDRSRSSSSIFFAVLGAIVTGSLFFFHDSILNTTTSTSSASSHISKDSAFLENIPYTQLRAAVIELYDASDPGTEDEKEQFYYAFRAMHKVEVDGLPVPITGVDGLYVGSLGAAYNLNGLQEEGITHIISLERGAPCRFPWLHTCLHIDYIWDNGKPEYNITQTFDATLPFISNALNSGGRVLVHCWNGESRSVSTIIAYMIKHMDIGPKTALKQIQETRPTAQPNKSYMKELREFRDENRKHKKRN